MSQAAVEVYEAEQIDPDFEVVDAEPENDYRLFQLSAEQLVEAGAVVSPVLQGVIERSNGEMTAQGVLQQVAAGQMQFWMVANGEGVGAVVGTSLDRAASGKKFATIQFCAGENSPQWLHLIEQIEEWARMEGCVSIKAVARKGWMKRLPTYKATHILLEKEL